MYPRMLFVISPTKSRCLGHVRFVMNPCHFPAQPFHLLLLTLFDPPSSPLYFPNLLEHEIIIFILSCCSIHPGYSVAAFSCLLMFCICEQALHLDVYTKSMFDSFAAAIHRLDCGGRSRKPKNCDKNCLPATSCSFHTAEL